MPTSNVLPLKKRPMLATLPPPSVYQFPPIPTVTAVRPTLEDVIYKIQSEGTKKPAILKVFSLNKLRKFNDKLDEINKAVINMQPQDAQQILKGLKDYKVVVAKMQEVAQHPLDHLPNNSRWQVRRFATLMITIYEDLQIAADTTPVDENSESYQAFMLKMCSSAPASEYVHGRKALFALFQD